MPRSFLRPMLSGGARPRRLRLPSVSVRSWATANDVRSAPHFRGPESASYSTCTVGNEVLLPHFITRTHGTVVF